MWTSIFGVAVIIFLVNVPCGYWREGLRKLSPLWFVAIHLPIPLVVFLRKATGIGYVWYSFPIFIVAYFGGQFLGSRYRRRKMLAVRDNASA